MPKSHSPEDIYKKYKERYNDILKSFSPDTFIVWLLDITNRCIYYNNAYISSFEKKHPLPSSLDDWVACIHPEDLEYVKKDWFAVTDGPEHGDDAENFYRVRCVGGGYTWFLSKSVIVERDELGKARYVVGVLISVDMLERKLEAATTWQERANFALEAARDGVWDWNAETNEVYYSPRYISMLGYLQNEFPATTEAWLTRIHKDDLEKTQMQQLAYIISPDRGDLFESTYRFLAADGSYRWILSRGKVVERDKGGRAKRIVGLHTDVTDLRAAQENLTALVNHDSLTNLYSRLYFDQAFKGLASEDEPVSIIYVDVDTLKVVNDSLGHDAGDRLLIIAADILRSAVRVTDITARIGGDEFAVLMPHCSSRTAESIISKLSDAQRQRNSDPENMPVFLSLGAAGTDQGISLNLLLREADQAMLRRKSMNREHSRRRMLEWVEHRRAGSGRRAGKDIV